MYGFSAQTWHLRVMVDFFPVWTQSLFVDIIGGSEKNVKSNDYNISDMKMKEVFITKKI